MRRTPRHRPATTAPDGQRSHPFGVLDSQRHHRAPAERVSEDVRRFERRLRVEDLQEIADHQIHCIRIGVVWFVTASVTPHVDEDQTILFLERLDVPEATPDGARQRCAVHHQQGWAIAHDLIGDPRTVHRISHVVQHPSSMGASYCAHELE